MLKGHVALKGTNNGSVGKLNGPDVLKGNWGGGKFIDSVALKGRGIVKFTRLFTLKGNWGGGKLKGPLVLKDTNGGGGGGN